MFCTFISGNCKQVAKLSIKLVTVPEANLASYAKRDRAMTT